MNWLRHELSLRLMKVSPQAPPTRQVSRGPRFNRLRSGAALPPSCAALAALRLRSVAAGDLSNTSATRTPTCRRSLQFMPAGQFMKALAFNSCRCNLQFILFFALGKKQKGADLSLAHKLLRDRTAQTVGIVYDFLLPRGVPHLFRQSQKISHFLYNKYIA